MLPKVKKAFIMEKERGALRWARLTALFCGAILVLLAAVSLLLVPKVLRTLRTEAEGGDAA